MITRIAPILFVYSIIVGCGSTPYSKEIWMEPEQISIQDNKEKQTVSYIARYLMTKEEALKLDENIRGSEWVGNALLAPTASLAGSLLATGNPLSLSGVNTFSDLNTALTVASWLLPEGGIMEKVSGIYLPKTWDGEFIETADRAKEVAIEHTEAQLRKTATAHNLSFSCIASCSSMVSRVYHLALTEKTDFSQYIYQAPGGVYVTTHWFDLEKPEQANLVENAAVGFDIGWRPEPGNTWVVNFWGTPILDENGDVEIGKLDNGFVYPSVSHDLGWTDLGLSLYKSFSDDGGYLFVGSEEPVPAFFAYKGKTYSYRKTRKSAERFIEYEIVQAERISP